MVREIAFFDVLIPTLLLLLIASAVIYFLMDRLLSEIDIDRYVWHPALVRFAVFVSLFSALGLWWYR